MKRTIRLTEGELKRMISESVKRTLKEAEDYGWVVETDEAQEAYNFAVEHMGKETVDDAIIRAMGDAQLAEILAYVFRMYDFEEWNEYKSSEEDEEEYEDDEW